MNTDLKILFVEDVQADALLAMRELKKGGINFTDIRVDTEEAFLQALANFKPDLIISDYSMPQFDGMTALLLKKEHVPQTPFILLTGSINEETAVECMKAGADDYLLKEHTSRISFAVKIVLENSRIKKEKLLADEALQKSIKDIKDYKYALDQSAIVSITDSEGIIKYVNENFCTLYGYTSKKAIGQNHNILINSGYHPKSFWKKFWQTIEKGKVIKAEICNRSKDGKLHWCDTTIVPFLNKMGKPYQYLAIRSDITEKRELEKVLMEQQKFITEMTIAAQEKERNELGKELHDNINQILATVKIYLDLAKAKDTIPRHLVEKSYEYVDMAMVEIRKLSHSLVAPSLGDIGLQGALEELVNNMNINNLHKVELINEISSAQLIDNKMELMVYRIIQEQMNNINKYAKAKKAVIHLSTGGKTLHLSVSDDGVGFDTSQKSMGIGLKNIKSRVEFYSGKLNIISAPGHGCSLEISIPF